MQTKNEREIAMSDKKFADFQLQPYLLTAIQKINFRQPTPVQQRVIPVIMAGRSVVGQSATGSGKTHAFLLPIFSKIKPEDQTVQAVITTPSREFWQPKFIMRPSNLISMLLILLPFTIMSVVQTSSIKLTN